MGDYGTEVFPLEKKNAKFNTKMHEFGSHRDAVFLEYSSHTDLCSNSGPETKAMSKSEIAK